MSLPSFKGWARVLPLLCVLLAVPANSATSGGDVERGAAIYEYYCYQCHGYDGDSHTLASTYLSPSPRNFRRTDPAVLSREAMIEAVSHGVGGTAMVGFTGVLDSHDISAVVDYVRSAFMHGGFGGARYHTEENGWPEHERYAAAFPFANGEFPLDAPAAQLTAEQVRGRRLYMQACISCHDRARVTHEGPVWETRALSYPRRHYSHRYPQPIDGVTSATPHTLHEQKPSVPDLSAAERRGELLFQQNCAFCHAADGTGRNWIGSFLEPHPRDLTSQRLANMEPKAISAAIEQGLPGTSMPAWGTVLSQREIRDITAYIRKAFVGAAADPKNLTDKGDGSLYRVETAIPVWRREAQGEAPVSK